MFWPPADYNDNNQLPECWLSMLTPADPASYVSSLKMHNQQKTNDDTTPASSTAGRNAGSTANVRQLVKHGEPDAAQQDLDQSAQVQLHPLVRPNSKYSEMWAHTMEFDEIEGLEEVIDFVKQQFETMLMSTHAAEMMSRSVNVSAQTRSRETGLFDSKMGAYVSKFAAASGGGGTPGGEAAARIASLVFANTQRKIVNSHPRKLRKSAISKNRKTIAEGKANDGVKKDSTVDAKPSSSPKKTMKPSAIITSWQKQLKTKYGGTGGEDDDEDEENNAIQENEEEDEEDESEEEEDEDDEEQSDRGDDEIDFMKFVEVSNHYQLK
jgi:hypothetical protein